MLVSFDIKFISLDQKQRRNGEACRASLACFWSSLINLISKDTWVSIYNAILADLLAKRHCETNEKQTQFCLNLLTWRMRYGVNR